MYTVKCIVQMTRELPCDSFLNFLEISMNKNISMLVVCGALAMSAQAAEQDATMKADVLGRHVTSTRNIPKAYIKDVKKSVNQKSDMVKTKSLAKVASYPSEAEIAKTYGIFEHRNGKRWYSLNNKNDIPESEYLKKINEIEDKDTARKKFEDEDKTKNTCLSIRDLSDYSVVKASDECVGKDFCTVKNIKLAGPPSLDRTISETIDFWNYESVINNSNLLQVTRNYSGHNIGISVTDIGVPFVEYEHVPSDKYFVITNNGLEIASSIIHGTKTSWVINHVASDATLYGLHEACGKTVPVDGYKKSPKIYIGNHSYGDGSFYYSATYIDDFIYATRTIEVASAGNLGYKKATAAQISEIATGVNVISVGAVHNNLTYHQTSSWANPKYSKKDDPSFSGEAYVKPEIANFSDILFPDKGAAGILNKHYDSEYQVLKPYFTQTSSSTPYTTASIALLLERYPFYRWHPEVVKALLLTSSIKKIIGAKDHDPDNGDYAMGVPDGRAMFEKNRSRFWNGNNEDFFVNKRISFTESGIQSGRKYRIAIAWLSSGTAVAQYGRLPQDINLKVKQNGRTIARSESTSNPFELVDFAAESGGDLEIIIERKEGMGENLGGRVLLGYNFLELPDAYQRR